MDLNRSFGFLVNDVARLFGRHFERNGHWLGMTRAQCRTLAYLARNEGVNQAGLADLLEIRPITLVRQIDRMEDAGWIERRADPADRRAHRLFLTEKARPILGGILAVAHETGEEAMAGLSRQEADSLVELLHRVHGNLSQRIALAPAPRGAPAEAPPDAPDAAAATERSTSRLRHPRTAMMPAVEGGR
jgi:DNA-binding MarR family transcriptional regulator